MADLFWPGDERAVLAFDQGSFLSTLLEVELCWSMALHEAGVAPTSIDVTEDWVTAHDLAHVAEAAEASGNPVVPLVALVRERLKERGHADAATWLHRGLTSQDVLDTAIMLGARATSELLIAHLDAAVDATVRLVERHRDDVMAGRTLTQHAVPITFGLKAAQWLQGLLDARDELRALRFPIQAGGAAGTLSALTEVAGDADAARFVVAECARILDLDTSSPWHTSRSPVTRYADALVRTTDALGRIANDVLVLARPEVGELAEGGAGRGGSSTMPHKQNPVLSVLVRRAALSAPGLAAQLHLAAAEAVDERPDGGWHTEWSTLATLSRRTLTAASQTAELVAHLRVDTARMAHTVKQNADALLSERTSIRTAAGLPEEPADPAHYLGVAGQLVDEIVARARGEEGA